MGAFAIEAGKQGLETANNVVNAGMGLLLGKINDKRQLKQQKKLQDMQMAGNKEMAIFNNAEALKMWDATNYAAQVKQMEKAGLSVAGMYGSGGGGGGATASQGSGVSGAAAPTGGGEVGMALQMGLMNAQIEQIKAATEKTKTETTKIAGADTNLTNATISNLAQDTQNKAIQHELMTIDKGLQEIELRLSTKNELNRELLQDDAVRILYSQVEILENEAGISTATKEAVIDEVKTRLAGAIIENELKKENINLTKEQIKAVAQEITQNPEYLDIAKRQVSAQELAVKNQFEIGVANAIITGITNAVGIGAVGKILKGNRTVVQGFGKKNY